jgi:hypothetical protein
MAFLGEPPSFWAKALVFGSFLDVIAYVFTRDIYWIALPIIKLPIAYSLIKD